MAAVMRAATLATMAVRVMVTATAERRANAAATDAVRATRLTTNAAVVVAAVAMAASYSDVDGGCCNGDGRGKGDSDKNIFPT